MPYLARNKRSRGCGRSEHHRQGKGGTSRYFTTRSNFGTDSEARRGKPFRKAKTKRAGSEFQFRYDGQSHRRSQRQQSVEGAKGFIRPKLKRKAGLSSSAFHAFFNDHRPRKTIPPKNVKRRLRNLPLPATHRSRGLLTSPTSPHWNRCQKQLRPPWDWTGWMPGVRLAAAAAEPRDCRSGGAVGWAQRYPTDYVQLTNSRRLAEPSCRLS